jgi:hypothetical protein
MNAFFEGRTSDSPYIEMIWRGHYEGGYTPVCPADEHWNILLGKTNRGVRVSIEGPTTQCVSKYHAEASEFLVIRFKLGTFIPYLPPGELVNVDATLPEAVSTTFWLNGRSWQFPDFENVETFVDQLVRNDVLVTDPIVKAVLQNQTPDMSFRTVRRRFLQATGIPHKAIQQIERARQAAALLGQGVSILDAVYQTGYADQPHMTRALKHYIGQTPAQIARVSEAV